MNRVDTILKPISPDYIGAYLGKSIQLYDLIEWLLLQTGKADITIISFSISEEFIRKIWKLKEMGLIGEIILVLDFKAMQKTQNLIRFASNVFNKMYFSKSHAKIVIIDSSTYQVSITGSQNCTRGNREESGIITTNLQVNQTLQTEVERIIANAIQHGTTNATE